MPVCRMHRRRNSAAMLLVVCWFCSVCAACAQTETEHVSLKDAQAEIAASHFAAAETICLRLLRTDPKDTAVSQALALTLYLEGRDTEALDVLHRLVAQSPSAKTWALIASSYCRLGEYGAAASALQKLKPWSQDDALLSQIAPCVLFAGAPFDGAEIYEMLLAHKAEPQDEYAVGLARAYIQASRKILGRLRSLPLNQPYAGAAEAARTSTSAEESSAFSLARKAVPALHPEMPVGAMESMLDANPQSPAALFGLGAIAGDRGVRAYEKALDLYPESVPLFLFQAEMLTSMNRIDDAASAYRDILRAFPDTPGVHFLIGSLYRSVHKWDDALVEFRAQSKITPEDERVMEAIDGCLQGAGKYAESYQYLKPVLTRARVPEWALQDFAVAAKNLGHPQESIAALLRAEALDPSDVSNHYRLFGLYQQTHDAPKAASELAVFNKLKSAEEAETSRHLKERKQQGIEPASQ